MSDLGQPCDDRPRSESVDGEHGFQVTLLSAFRAAVKKGASKQESDEILDKFVDFTKMHFMSEQTLMRLYNYPLYQDHVAEHERMIERITLLRAKWLGGEQPITAATVDALVDDLAGHIKHQDGDLCRFLANISAGR